VYLSFYGLTLTWIIDDFVAIDRLGFSFVFVSYDNGQWRNIVNIVGHRMSDRITLGKMFGFFYYKKRQNKPYFFLSYEMVAMA